MSGRSQFSVGFQTELNASGRVAGVRSRCCRRRTSMLGGKSTG